MKNNIDKLIEDQKYRLSLENKYMKFRYEKQKFHDGKYNHQLISKHKSSDDYGKTKKPVSRTSKNQPPKTGKITAKPGNTPANKKYNKPTGQKQNHYNKNTAPKKQYPVNKKNVKNVQPNQNKKYNPKNNVRHYEPKKAPAYVTHEDLVQKPKRRFILFKKEYAVPFSGIAIPAFLVIMMIINILSEPKAVSEQENRTLAQFPEISFKSLLSGSFMSDFETYISDQFSFRNSFVASKRRFEILTGKKENRNIIIADDGYLIENTSELTESNLNANIEAINQLASIPRYNITVSIVPTAYEVMQNKLPKFAYVNAYGKLQEKLRNQVANVKIADVQPILEKNSDQYIYYRSDHHQTALGSYYLYKALSKPLEYSPYSIDSFEAEKVAEGFYGTAWSNSGFSKTVPDEIYRYTLKEDGAECTVDFPLDNEEMDSLYNNEHLAEKDKYAYFLDGNHALTIIRSDCNTKEKLIIIKDSFAHSLVPYLANHYSEIHMIDLRYFNEDIFKYLYETNISRVLILYNQNTFMTDTNLSKVSAFFNSSEYTTVPSVPFGIVPELEQVEEDYFNDAMFVGDSLTVGIKNFTGLSSEFLCTAGLNTRVLDSKAIGTDKKSVLETIYEKEHLGKLYIMLGTNEVAYDEPEEFIDRYATFIDKVREKFPNILIYVQSIMPVSEERSNSSKITNERIEEHNNMLIEMSEEKECFYLDYHSHFVDENGALPPGTASDGIHPSPPGYQEIGDYIRVHAVPVSNTENVAGKEPKKTFTDDGKTDLIQIARNILEMIEFKDELIKVSDTLVVSNYGLDTSKVAYAALYLGGGSTAEEIAVFEAKSESYAKAIETKLAPKRIENKKKDYENYMPAEMTKLKSPVIVRKGNVVAVCIADSVSEDEILAAIG